MILYDIIRLLKERNIMVRSNIEIKQITHWIEMGINKDGTHNICCGYCGKGKLKSKGHANSPYTRNKYKFCIECGADMRGGTNEADN